jgi:hypothetical protein
MKLEKNYQRDDNYTLTSQSVLGKNSILFLSILILVFKLLKFGNCNRNCISLYNIS